MIKLYRGRNLINTEQGVTLVEVMISVLILSFVTVGTLAMFAKCSLFAGSIKEHSIVNNGLNERMEEIRNMAFSAITNLGSSSTFTATGFTELSNPTGTVTVDDPFTDDDIKRVTVTVTWDTRQGRAMTKSMSAYVANSGINRQ